MLVPAAHAVQRRAVQSLSRSRYVRWVQYVPRQLPLTALSWDDTSANVHWEERMSAEKKSFMQIMAASCTCSCVPSTVMDVRVKHVHAFRSPPKASSLARPAQNVKRVLLGLGVFTISTVCTGGMIFCPHAACMDRSSASSPRPCLFNTPTHGVRARAIQLMIHITIFTRCNR
jgi:hypothetical protein